MRYCDQYSLIEVDIISHQTFAILTVEVHVDINIAISLGEIDVNHVTNTVIIIVLHVLIYCI